MLVIALFVVTITFEAATVLSEVIAPAVKITFVELLVDPSAGIDLTAGF